MWLFLPEGMFSISIVPKSAVVQIRARQRSHLENLLGSGVIGHPKIHQRKTSDYEYRVKVSKGDLNKLMSHVIHKLEYSDFKKQVSLSSNDPQYIEFCSDVWLEGHKQIGNNFSEYVRHTN